MKSQVNTFLFLLAIWLSVSVAQTRTQTNASNRRRLDQVVVNPPPQPAAVQPDPAVANGQQVVAEAQGGGVPIDASEGQQQPQPQPQPQNPPPPAPVEPQPEPPGAPPVDAQANQAFVVEQPVPEQQVDPPVVPPVEPPVAPPPVDPVPVAAPVEPPVKAPVARPLAPVGVQTTAPPTNTNQQDETFSSPCNESDSCEACRENAQKVKQSTSDARTCTYAIGAEDVFICEEVDTTTETESRDMCSDSGSEAVIPDKMTAAPFPVVIADDDSGGFGFGLFILVALIAGVYFGKKKLEERGIDTSAAVKNLMEGSDLNSIFTATQGSSGGTSNQKYEKCVSILHYSSVLFIFTTHLQCIDFLIAFSVCRFLQTKMTTRNGVGKMGKRVGTLKWPQNQPNQIS